MNNITRQSMFSSNLINSGKPGKVCRKAVSMALLMLGIGQASAANLVYDADATISTPETADSSFWIGENNTGVDVTITNTGSVTVNTGNSCTLGVNPDSDSNSLVANGPLTVAGDSNMNVGYYGASNVFTLGASVTGSANNLNVGVFAGATGNTVTINGTFNAAANINLGYGAGGNTLNVNANGTLNNGGDAVIGLVAGAAGNTANITGPSGVWTSTGIFYAGYASSLNKVNITAAGKVTANAKDLLIGAEPGANDNQILVTGPSSELSNNNATLYVGRSGNNNRLDIQNQGLVSSKNVRIGGGTGASGNPTGNGAYVDGAGSIWNITGTLRVGAGVAGTDSGLDITNDGVVNVTGNSFMGYDATSNGNHITIDGSKSNLNVKNLLVGGGGQIPPQRSIENRVTIENDGTLSATGSIDSILDPNTSIRINKSNEIAFGPGNGKINNTNAVYSMGVLSSMPGSIGTITGDYTQDALGIFRTHITDNSTFGQVQVAGNVAMTAPAKLDVHVDDCRQVIPPATFPAIFSANNALPVNTFTVTDNCSGLIFTAQLSADTKAIDLFVVANPGGAANQHCRFFGNCQ